MKEKKQRLEVIKELIINQEIGSQEELLSLLTKQGYELTQATLSRDLKRLRASKQANKAGRGVYAILADTSFVRSSDPEFAPNVANKGFISLQFSANIAVIRTKIGLASSIAYDIDNAHLGSILGTIAGDDTIMVVIKEGYSHTIVSEQIYNVLNNE